MFFDLYETLITEWENNEKKATYSIEALGIDKKTYKKEWALRRERRMDGTYPDHKSVLRDILQSLGKPVDESMIDKVDQLRVESKRVPFQDINHEVLEMLQKLKDMNVKLGLISNCTPEEVLDWETTPLAELFDDVIFSYEVKLAKPNVEIYQLGCQNLGVSPEESIFIGDGGSDELIGASKAGLKAYQATWFLPTYFSEKITDYPKLQKPIQLFDVIKL
ncbi:HAD family hydrolase [Ornithinibacillus halotolerans]|uniref:HAD family hydrolase n=1 Tax=Ornithinibacillus halotolerans TaxID=1274357 RepID=UPI001667370D|nr:HAD family hydrolase [Ornithinibacillus halotolerans]